jgi:hypothetical protein
LGFNYGVLGAKHSVCRAMIPLNVVRLVDYVIFGLAGELYKHSSPGVILSQTMCIDQSKISL